jgi:hypothetical protein
MRGRSAPTDTLLGRLREEAVRPRYTCTSWPCANSKPTVSTAVGADPGPQSVLGLVELRPVPSVSLVGPHALRPPYLALLPLSPISCRLPVGGAVTAADQGQLTRARSSPEQPLCAQDPLVYFSLAERPAARAKPTITRPCRR